MRDLQQEIAKLRKEIALNQSKTQKDGQEIAKNLHEIEKRAREITVKVEKQIRATNTLGSKLPSNPRAVENALRAALAAYESEYGDPLDPEHWVHAARRALGLPAKRSDEEDTDE